MTENENSVVDASILFGGTSAPSPKPADDGGIPDFLRRKPNDPNRETEITVEQVSKETIDDVVVADTAGSVAADQSAGAGGAAAGEAFGTTEDASGQVTITDQAGPINEPALVSNAPSEVEKAAHSPVPEHTPVGHNNPPEEPLTKEEMLKDMWKDIGAYGKASGAGAAALPRLGLRVIRAAADGLISNEKPKGGEKSDAVRIYERYAEQDSKHAEHSKGGMKANAAKLNALIGLGCMTTVDGVEVADRAVKLRDKMEKDELKPKALFAGLVDVARAQMEQDQPLTDDAIMGALGKVTKDKTLEEEWEAIYKRIEKVISGENPQGLKDQTDRAIKIGEMVKEHIDNFVVDAKTEDDIAFCMERGMSRAEAVAFVNKRS